jgi:hypothetical protein
VFEGCFGALATAGAGVGANVERKAGPAAARGRSRTLRGMSTTTDSRPLWLRNWLERHQTRFSFVLHMIGIPLTILFIPLAIWQLVEWRWDLWWRPTLLLFLGYLLQYIGHVYEGNDMGEIILIKKWLGKPYVAVSPRFQK